MLLAGCAPPQFGCHIGTHQAEVADVRHDPEADGALGKLRAGEPLVCGLKLRF